MTEMTLANMAAAGCGIIVVVLAASFSLIVYLFWEEVLLELGRNYSFCKRIYNSLYGSLGNDEEIVHCIAKVSVFLGTADIVVPILVVCTYSYLADTTIIEMWNQIKWRA